jgi:hypothetical protein
MSWSKKTDKDPKPNNKNKFLYISGDSQQIIHFVGYQQEMYQYFDKTYDPLESNNSRGRLFFKEKNDGDHNGRYGVAKRIVSLVVERQENQIKAFACPLSLWNQMVEHSKDNDFLVWREGKGLTTRYYCDPLGVFDVDPDLQKIADATLESFSFVDIFVNNDWKIVSEAVEKINDRWQILDL